jgi:hypothetical protein
MTERNASGTGDEPGFTHDDDDVDAPRVTPAAVAVTIAVLLAVAVIAMHLTLPAVTGPQAVPDGHYPGPCWVCHNISPEAK